MKAQKGSSIIEVLITIVIFSVGVLGALKLQIISLESNKSGFDRSLALVLAGDMAERIKANKKAEYKDFNTDSPEEKVDCSNFCSSDKLVNFDYYEWGLNFKNEIIPEGVGKVYNLGNSNYKIEVSWNEKEWEESGYRENRDFKVTLFIMV